MVAMPNPRILIVEDEDTVRLAMEAALRKEGHDTLSVSDAEQAMDILQRSPVDLIITDMHLPGASGIELLHKTRANYPSTAVIMMTAFGTVQSAVEAMKSGAYDYLTKPVHSYELKILVKRFLDHHRLIEEVDVLRSCLDQRYGFDKIIGSSATLMRPLDTAARIAASDVTVLIQGETGTGKELVAKAIHFRSPRRDQPFITVNCGAIPRDLLESELFGHMKGSFTGAVAHKKGKVEAADGGTILLDEIGEMPLDLQVRVLRLIQEHEIEKIGAGSSIKLDVRIIAATHRNLLTMVEAGSFREDLYYRLMVVPIELPPLRERPEDIPELVRHFFTKCKIKHARGDLSLAADLLPYFCDYHWPGNVRQLENTVERIVLLSAGSEVTPFDLPNFLTPVHPAVKVLPAPLPDDGLDLEAVQKELIVRAMRKFGGNQTRAARFLQLSRRTLAYRLQKYGIAPPEISEAGPTPIE
jgi:two-component system, NtrC family, response regulator